MASAAPYLVLLLVLCCIGLSTQDDLALDYYDSYRMTRPEEALSLSYFPRPAPLQRVDAGPEALFKQFLRQACAPPVNPVALSRQLGLPHDALQQACWKHLAPTNLDLKSVLWKLMDPSIGVPVKQAPYLLKSSYARSSN